MPVTECVFGDVRMARDAGAQYYWSLLSGSGSLSDWIKIGLKSETAAGAGGRDLTYVHLQETAARTWTIQHNLAKFPSVAVIDSSNKIVIGQVTYANVNRVIVTFESRGLPVAFSGKAYLN